MDNLKTIKARSQEGLTRLVEVSKQQPPEVQLWGTVAASALVAGVVIAAGAKGLLAIVGILAAPPIAITVGALGGGAIGWSYMQNRRQPTETEQSATGS